MVATDFNEEYEVKHKPVIDPETLDLFWIRCSFVLPSGNVCDRRVNFVPTDAEWYPGEKVPGHWRHNPRPYRNR